MDASPLSKEVQEKYDICVLIALNYFVKHVAPGGEMVIPFDVVKDIQPLNPAFRVDADKNLHIKMSKFPGVQYRDSIQDA